MNRLSIENIRIALKAIKSQWLRTILTVLIIAIGITALVGILTAIDSIEKSISSEFAMMGSNTFNIRNRGSNIRIGKSGQKPKRYKPISYKEAMRFRQLYNYPSKISVSAFAAWDATLKYKAKKTNPNVTVFGGNEHYLVTGGNELGLGRNFNIHEIRDNAHVVILGHELAETLFENEYPLDKVITIAGGKYKVIGVLKKKGSSIGHSSDRNCIVPLTSARQYFPQKRRSFVISVMTEGPQFLDAAIGEATGLFRVIRGVPLGEEDSFEITRSDNLALMLIENLSKVTWVATIIGMITLLGAAISLMNIMLVSVSERTREIGTRKAIGANKSLILKQFLIESIVICQIGGLVGMTLGILIGNITSYMLNISFIIPWAWMILAVVLCIIVGLISGIYPAFKASQLDPIEALRYE